VPDRVAILAIPGCGRYVADSFDLFYRGNLDCEPIDPILITYRDATRRRFAEAQERRNFDRERFPGIDNFVKNARPAFDQIFGTGRRCPECEDER
jgi:hypothetical protein